MMMALPVDHNRGNSGFTLVELMIALLLGTIVMAAVMASFQSQHSTYIAQDQVVEMQQNARVAMDMLVRDIRSAGYDPTVDKTLGAGIITAEPKKLGFTRDNGAGGLETLEYSLFDAFEFTVPPSNDGLPDDLAREFTPAGGAAGGRQVVAENISSLEFRYLDGAGAVTAVPANIRTIQVSIMVQAAQPDTKSPPPIRTYATPSGDNFTSTAGFRSLFLTSTVQCRNLGL
jgi:type IV pilus assembly protein PilW